MIGKRGTLKRGVFPKRYQKSTQSRRLRRLKLKENKQQK